MQTALRIGPQDAQGGTAAPCKLLPGHQVGVVLQAADDDLVPRSQPGRACACGAQPVGYQVQRFGGARRKHQLMRVACADEAFEALRACSKASVARWLEVCTPRWILARWVSSNWRMADRTGSGICVVAALSR